MIKFSNYFNDWLYGQDGYYSNYKQIGKDGDFFTSVSTSSFFGGSIAKKIIDSIEEWVFTIQYNYFRNWCTPWIFIS
jgi:SAM-dependent MidA family methyltransferase